ncbi:glycosyltransferase family protein [Flavitalea antarctica]
MTPAPILLFTYNRLKHTRNTVEALKANTLAKQTDLLVFSDAAKIPEAVPAVLSVRAYLHTITGFRKVIIIERETNYGLGRNIISGVSQILQTAQSAIVIEDDLVVSPYFLDFMNDGLRIYENEQQVISIHGYTYPVSRTLPETFFIKGADCLGWATWQRSWKEFESDGQVLLDRLIAEKKTDEFDFGGTFPFTQMLKDQIEGKNTSWAVRWYASAFLNDRYTLYPGKSLVYHAGGDGTGTNTGFNSLLDVELSKDRITVERKEVKQDEQAYVEFKKFHKLTTSPGLMYRIRRKLQAMMNRPS